MARLGMHFSLWGPSWTREAAEIAVPEAARHGLQVIEIPLLAPDSIDVAARPRLAGRPRHRRVGPPVPAGRPHGAGQSGRRPSSS